MDYAMKGKAIGLSCEGRGDKEEMGGGGKEDFRSEISDLCFGDDVGYLG